MEQHLGHQAFYQNLRFFMDQLPAVENTWVEVSYRSPESVWEKLPLLPKKLQGTLVGRSQVRDGLAQAKFDLAVFNTQVPAVLAGNSVHKQPYFIFTDITPIQYDQLGAFYEHQPDRADLIKRYKHQVNRNLLRSAARVFPWSTWTGSSLVEDYDVPPERIEVLPPGVNTDIWQPGKRQSGAAVKILFVGGDFYRKGGSLLLEACSLLPAGMVELALVTRSKISGNDWITVYNQMAPNSPELIALYQSCDIFVLPTYAEAFGIAAIEACAAGLPVIASAVGGLTDIVSHGDNGFLLSPVTAEALAEKILCLAEDRDLRIQMGQSARDKAVAKFDARANATRLHDIILQYLKH